MGQSLRFEASFERFLNREYNFASRHAQAWH
jgi:hypothetical protein